MPCNIRARSNQTTLVEVIWLRFRISEKAHTVTKTYFIAATTDAVAVVKNVFKQSERSKEKAIVRLLGLIQSADEKSNCDTLMPPAGVSRREKEAAKEALRQKEKNADEKKPLQEALNEGRFSQRSEWNVVVKIADTRGIQQHWILTTFAGKNYLV